jgi:O-antigen/teichoic acid export membrane protein
LTTSQDLTRGGLLARNVALNFAGWLLPAIAAIVAVPILVRAMGDARFGVLALAWTTLGYFSLFDLGIGRAVTHAIANKVAQDRGQEIGGVVWTSLALLVPVGVVGAALLFVASPWLVSMLNVPANLRTETTTAFRVLSLAIPFAGATAALRGVLEARQLFGVVNALRVPHGVLMFLGPVAVLPFSRSVVPAVAILTIARATLCLAHYVVCRRRVSELAGRPFEWSREAVRPLLTFGGWMTVSNIVSPLMNTLDRFVVGAFLGVSIVTYYAAPSELVTKMWLFTAAIHPVVFPALASTGARNREQTAALFDRMLRVTFAGLLLPTALLVLLAPEILALWLGRAFAAQSTSVLQILAIAVFVNTLGQGALILVHALGRPDITGKYHVAELPFWAVALWFLLPRFGIAGAAIAWAARAIVDAVLLLLTCPALLRETRTAVNKTLVLLFAAMLALGACLLLSHAATRYAVAVVVVPIWLGVAWRWMLTPQERTAPSRALNAVWRPEQA